MKVKDFVEDYKEICKQHGLHVDGYDFGPFIHDNNGFFDLDKHIKEIKDNIKNPDLK